MEFVVALFFLYAAQCVVWLPHGCVLLARITRSSIETEGPGWCLLNPRPSANSLVGTRPPLSLRDGELYAPGAPSWWRGGTRSDEGPHFDPGGDEPVELRGRRARSGPASLARGVTAAHAAHLVRFFEDLRGRGDGELRTRVSQRIDASLDLEALRGSLESIRHATRWLAPILDVYALMALVALPAAVLLLGAEPVIWRVLPVFALLHIAAITTFVRAHRRLKPGQGGALVETLLAACLYPPVLLRASAEFSLERSLLYHPAAVACVSLPLKEALSFVRTEVLRCRSERDDDWLVSREHAGLLGLAAGMGESSASLFAPPSREDPWASAFCPGCHVEYRRATGACTDCETALEAFQI